MRQIQSGTGQSTGVKAPLSLCQRTAVIRAGEKIYNSPAAEAVGTVSAMAGLIAVASVPTAKTQSNLPNPIRYWAEV